MQTKGKPYTVHNGSVPRETGHQAQNWHSPKSKEQNKTDANKVINTALCYMCLHHICFFGGMDSDVPAIPLWFFYNYNTPCKADDWDWLQLDGDWIRSPVPWKEQLGCELSFGG